MDSVIVFCAKYLIFAIFLLAAHVWYRTEKRREYFLAVVLAGVLAYAIFTMAGTLYYHPRPFVTEHIKPLISHVADNSFPSEHTVAAFSLAAVVYFYRKRYAAVALILGLGVAIGRVLSHVHSWIDVISGAVIGVAAGYAAVLLAKYLIPKINARLPKSRH